MVSRLVWIALALSVAAGLLLPAPDPSLRWWHRLFGFHALYGLLGCVAIVAISKALGKAGLQRPEDEDG
jgi:hypothetical protein